MTIVKEIFELHHGRIEIESEPGRGTAVTLLLPIVDAPAGG
jgi:signal transduction histidine kinase